MGAQRTSTSRMTDPPLVRLLMSARAPTSAPAMFLRPLVVFRGRRMWLRSRPRARSLLGRWGEMRSRPANKTAPRVMRPSRRFVPGRAGRAAAMRRSIILGVPFRFHLRLLVLFTQLVYFLLERFDVRLKKQYVTHGFNIVKHSRTFPIDQNYVRMKSRSIVKILSSLKTAEEIFLNENRRVLLLLLPSVDCTAAIFSCRHPWFPLRSLRIRCTRRGILAVVVWASSLSNIYTRTLLLPVGSVQIRPFLTNRSCSSTITALGFCSFQTTTLVSTLRLSGTEIIIDVVVAQSIPLFF